MKWIRRWYCLLLLVRRWSSQSGCSGMCVSMCASDIRQIQMLAYCDEMLKKRKFYQTVRRCANFWHTKNGSRTSFPVCARMKEVTCLNKLISGIIFIWFETLMSEPSLNNFLEGSLHIYKYNVPETFPLHKNHNWLWSAKLVWTLGGAAECQQWL